MSVDELMFRRNSIAGKQIPVFYGVQRAQKPRKVSVLSQMKSLHAFPSPVFNPVRAFPSIHSTPSTWRLNFNNYLSSIRNIKWTQRMSEVLFHHSFVNTTYFFSSRLECYMDEYILRAYLNFKKIT